MNLNKTIKKITTSKIVTKMKGGRIYNLVSGFIEKITIKPRWNEIRGGILKGGHIFIDPTGGWKDMVTGEYDKFFFDFLEKQNLENKVIYDIGAHIGYNSLVFAKMVGSNGKVFSFEPNIFNKKRFELILSRNKEFSEIIKIMNVAISNKNGEDDFIFNKNVDNCKSSGSFVDGSHTFFEKSSYERSMGFERVKIKTVSMDSLDSIGIVDKPDLIKIDIEGAEFLALEGGLSLLAEHKPILLIEIHSIFNMLKVYEILTKLNYKIDLLKEESDGRCFISATI